MARPKQRIGVAVESRSIKRVTTGLQNASEPESTGTSSQEPSIETYDSGGFPETWLEDAMQEESPETAPPNPPKDEDCKLWKPVGGPKPEHPGLNDRQTVEPARGFDCTTCGKKYYSGRDIEDHPLLKVGICKPCWRFLFSSPYTKSSRDGSEEQCRWCGEGGRIVMCDDCDKVFCQSCIVRNFGPQTLAEIVGSIHWSCFICKPELLRVPISELEKFRNSLPSADRVPVARRHASFPRNSRKTRNATNYFPGADDGEGATIADLLAEDEERRKRNPEVWNKPRGKPGRKPGWNSAGASRLPGSKKRAGVCPDGALPRQPGGVRVRRATESNVTIADIVQQAAAVPSAPPTRTYIRPHQHMEKRQQAVERRRRAEAERLKNATNPLNDAHFQPQREDPGKLPCDNGVAQVKSENLPDVAVGNEGKVERRIFCAERSSGGLMQNTFGNATAKNLFTNFTGASKP